MPGDPAPELQPRSNAPSARRSPVAPLPRRAAALLGALACIPFGIAWPAQAQAAPAAPTPSATAAPTPLSPAPRSANPDPAEAAFGRGTAILATRCQEIKAAYEREDRRPGLIRELADCYLIEADLWRAEAMRADADRLEAAAAAEPGPRPPDGEDLIDLAVLRRQWQEACGEFERSLELEPSPGAQIAVALCRLRQDKLASSRQLLEGMLPQMIARAGSGDPFDVNRLSLVQAMLKEIGRAQPRLLLRASRTPQPELAANGRPLAANEAHPLDAGTYRVTARRAASIAETTVTLAPGGSYTLMLDETSPEVSRNWRRATLTLAGSAAATALIGAGAWWYASRRLDDFESLGGTEGEKLVCNIGADNAACNDAADDVNLWRGVRTAGLVAAGALAGAALIVYFATPEPQPARLQWIPAMDREQLSLAVRGGF